MRARLVTDVLMEIHSVQAYVGLWGGSTLVPEPECRLVADTVQELCGDAMLPWPETEIETFPNFEKRQFVKANLMEVLNLGVGDLKQSPTVN